MFAHVSYKTKLLLRIMPIILTGMFLLSGGSYWYVNRLIKDDLTASMLATTGRTADSINTWLQTLMLEPQTMAATPEARVINRDFRPIDSLNIERYKVLHERRPDLFQDIYAANSSGEYHAVRIGQDGYSIFTGNIANRPYFRSIMSGGTTQITPPLTSRTTGKPTIFIVSPIRDENRAPQGLVGTGIALDYVQRVAQELKAGSSGYGVVVDNEGLLMVHPDKSIAMQKKVYEIGDDSTRELGQRMLSGGSGVFRYTYNGLKKIAFYKPVPIAGWSVATVLPEDELFAPLSHLLTALMLITLVVTILSGVAIMVAARRLTGPLLDLTVQVQAIASGNLDARVKNITGNDEIGQLAEKFNAMTEKLSHMLRALEDNNSKLEREIREREQAQQALAASEEKFSKAFSHVSDFVGIIRLRDRVYLDVNDACFKLLGFRRDEIVGHTSDEFDLWEDRDLRDRAYSNVKETGFIYNFEAWMRTKSGERRFGLISAEVAEIGGEACVVYAWRDMTERKLAEDALRSAQDELVRQEKLAMLGRLSGMVSHELRNPLSVISNAVYLLQLKSADADGKTREYLGIIKHEIENTTRIIGDLLDFARTRPPQPVAVGIEQLLENSLKRCAIPDTVRLSRDLPELLPLLQVDPQRIEQVLQNLITNALQAMPEGGALCISAKPVHGSRFPVQGSDIEPRTTNLEPNGDFMEISVSDTGVGIAPENLPKLFQPLFTTRPKGIGLGLVVCKNLVEGNGGKIEVSSEPGRGTTFRVTLPAAEAV